MVLGSTEASGETRSAMRAKNGRRETRRFLTCGMAVNISGLSAIVRIEAATTMLIVPGVAIPSAMPWPQRMKENSPSCETQAPMTRAVSSGQPRSNTSAAVTLLVMHMMMSITAITAQGSFTKTYGSSMRPTEMKNSTENASCNGRQLRAARCAKLDSRITMPAKKAPRA